MRKDYESPIVTSIDLNVTEKFLAGSDVQDIPLDGTPGNADTQKKRADWMMNYNDWK